MVVAWRDLGEGVVAVGSRVRIRYEEDGFEEVYEVVPEGAEDISNGRVSSKTPVGKAILGAKEGEVRQYGTSKKFGVRILEIF